MSKFKVGDKVMLANIDSPYGGSFESGPNNPFNVVGEVVFNGAVQDLPLRVKWGNGWINGYRESNLRPVLLEENV